MRHGNHDPRHFGLRVSTRCSALLVALALASTPVLGHASAPAPAPAPAEPPVTTTPDVVFEITPAPEPQLPEPEPEPPPPLLLPPPEPVPPVEEPVSDEPPVDLEQVRTMRKAGIGVMTAGGVVAVAGLGVTIAFSALGHKAQNQDEPDIDDVEKKNDLAGVGGLLVASGIAIIAIGGIVYTTAKRRAAKVQTARIRVAPTAGGLALRF